MIRLGRKLQRNTRKRRSNRMRGGGRGLRWRDKYICQWAARMEWGDGFDGLIRRHEYQ